MTIVGPKDDHTAIDRPSTQPPRPASQRPGLIDLDGWGLSQGERVVNGFNPSGCAHHAGT